MGRPVPNTGPVTGRAERPSRKPPETRKADDQILQPTTPIAAPQAKISLRTLHAAERALLIAAERQARRVALSTIAVLAAERKQAFTALLDAEFATRLADILKSTPQSEQHAAIMRLRGEQEAKSTAMSRDEDAAAASARRAARGILAQRRLAGLTSLSRRHRAERIHLGLRVRRPMASWGRTNRPRMAVRRVAAGLLAPTPLLSPR